MVATWNGSKSRMLYIILKKLTSKHEIKQLCIINQLLIFFSGGQDGGGEASGEVEGVNENLWGKTPPSDLVSHTHKHTAKNVITKYVKRPRLRPKADMMAEVQTRQ